MLDYLKNLLPRLSKYSKNLDHQELFVDLPWVLMDEDGNKQQYIFKRDGRLLMALNGKGQEGKWEYVSAAKSLWIDRGVDKLLLNHAFFDEAVMILKLDGDNNRPWILANAIRIPNLDVVTYLQRLADKMGTQSNPYLSDFNVQNIITYKSVHGDTISIHTNKFKQKLPGQLVKLNGKYITNDQFELEDGTVIFVDDGKLIL